MNRSKLIIVIFLVFFSIFERPVWAGNLTEAEILHRFDLMRAGECRKPKGKEPALPASSFYEKNDASSNVGWRERFFYDIDGDGTCEILDSWVDRLTPRFNDYRLDHFYANYRYENGRWMKQEDLRYVPKYQIRDKITRRIYYLFDFDFNTQTGLWIHVHGVSYFDRWPTRKESLNRYPLSGVGARYGIHVCSYDEYFCDGFDLGKIAEVLSKQRVP